MPTQHYVQKFVHKYLQIAIFYEKQVSFKLKVIFSTNFRPKTKKIVRVVFEKNIKVSDFGLIWRPFRKYLQIKNFFQKSGSVTFYLYSLLTSCKKSEKLLQPLLRKLRYQPTNQPTNLPTNYYQQHRFYRTWLTRVQKSKILWCLWWIETSLLNINKS